jgi:hypothetical protein
VPCANPGWFFQKESEVWLPSFQKKKFGAVSLLERRKMKTMKQIGHGYTNVRLNYFIMILPCLPTVC